MPQSISSTTSLTLVTSPSLRLIEADLAARGLPPNTRQLYLFLWRARTQPKRLPLGLIFSEVTLATEIHTSVRTVQRSLQRLVAQDLLRITPRVRLDGGASTNRYTLTWHPLAQAHPTTSRAPMNLEPSVSEDSVADNTLPVTPDAIFVWPTLSGDPTTVCQGGVDPQEPTVQSFDGFSDDPISNQETYSMSDQPVPGAAIWTFDTLDALRAFLFAQLTAQDIPSRRIGRWIRHYDLERVAQVTLWILSAPPGSIRSPGGWMARALLEEWAAPLWVRRARERRIITARAVAAMDAQAEQERAVGRKMAEHREQDDRRWADIAPRLTQLPELYAHACQLAQAALKSTFRFVFKPGSPVERAWVLQAARERPDLVREKDRLA